MIIVVLNQIKVLTIWFRSTPFNERVLIMINICLASELIVNVVIKYRPLGLTRWILDF